VDGIPENGSTNRSAIAFAAIAAAAVQGGTTTAVSVVAEHVATMTPSDQQLAERIDGGSGGRGSGRGDEENTTMPPAESSKADSARQTKKLRHLKILFAVALLLVIGVIVAVLTALQVTGGKDAADSANLNVEGPTQDPYEVSSNATNANTHITQTTTTMTLNAVMMALVV